MAFQRKAIFVIAVLVAIMTALAVTSGAKAHYGNKWFTTKAAVTTAVEGKYRLDVFQKCFVAHVQANVLNDKNGFGGASYDHFICLVDSLASGRTCWLTVHQTGQRWSDIVITSDTGTKIHGGCGPSDIRRR